MEIQGKIIQIGTVESGVSKQGNNWSKQAFAIETLDKYPKKVFLIMMNAKLIEAFSYYELDYIIKCSVNIESKEYNGKWYTQVQVWKFEGDAANKKQSEPQTENDPYTGGQNDDLPF